MSDKIFIIPDPKNPEGTDDGKWRIMINENGKDRWLNVADDHTDAVIKAERTAAKRGISCDLDHPAYMAPAEVEVEVDPDTPSYMRVPRPRGAPNIGEAIKFIRPDESEVQLEVSYYLAEQFVGLDAAGKSHVVHLNEDWTRLGR